MTSNNFSPNYPRTHPHLYRESPGNYVGINCGVENQGNGVVTVDPSPGSQTDTVIQVTPNVSVTNNNHGKTVADAYAKWAKNRADASTMAALLAIRDPGGEGLLESNDWVEFCQETKLCGDTVRDDFIAVAGLFNNNIGPGGSTTGLADLRLGCGESFTPDTQVALADGSAKAIAQMRVGDVVEATDTSTGKSAPRPVTAVMVKRDVDLMDIVVKAGDRTDVVHATQDHLFWDDSRHAWTKAHELVKGDRLLSDDGSTVTVVATTVVPGTAFMWDLTVQQSHDFYVRVSAHFVLVHNDSCKVTRTFQTYIMVNEDTGEVYSGRTSGFGTPAQNLAKRYSSHERRADGFGPPQLDQTSDNKLAIRGREQANIDFFRKIGLAPSDQINGISPRRKGFLPKALTASSTEFGEEPPAGFGGLEGGDDEEP